MSPTKAGIIAAAVFAGPSLYGLVQSGQLDASSALMRGLLIAAGCAFGISWLVSLVKGYEAEQDTHAKAVQRFLDEADATDLAAAEAALRRSEQAEASGPTPPGPPFQAMIKPPEK